MFSDFKKGSYILYFSHTCPLVISTLFIWLLLSLRQFEHAKPLHCLSRMGLLMCVWVRVCVCLRARACVCERVCGLARDDNALGTGKYEIFCSSQYLQDLMSILACSLLFSVCLQCDVM